MNQKHDVNLTQGTPKNLKEALDRAGKDVSADGLLIIRDFLAQRFCAAVIEHSEAEDILRDLFKKCVGEE